MIEGHCIKFQDSLALRNDNRQLCSTASPLHRSQRWRCITQHKIYTVQTFTSDQSVGRRNSHWLWENVTLETRNSSPIHDGIWDFLVAFISKRRVGSSILSWWEPVPLQLDCSPWLKWSHSRDKLPSIRTLFQTRNVKLIEKMLRFLCELTQFTKWWPRSHACFCFGSWARDWPFDLWCNGSSSHDYTWPAASVPLHTPFHRLGVSWPVGNHHWFTNKRLYLCCA